MASPVHAFASTAPGSTPADQGTARVLQSASFDACRWKRFGTPEEVAGAWPSFCSPAARLGGSRINMRWRPHGMADSIKSVPESFPAETARRKRTGTIPYRPPPGLRFRQKNALSAGGAHVVSTPDLRFLPDPQPRRNIRVGARPVPRSHRRTTSARLPEICSATA